MKKHLLFALCLVLMLSLFGFVGCNSDKGIHVHKFTSSVVDATCTTPGSKIYTCDCGKNNVEERPALGHVAVIDEAKDVSCTQTGLTAGIHCSRCGEILVAQEIIPAGHKVVVDQALVPTCTQTGLTEGSHCLRCGEILVAQEVLPALNHVEVVDKKVEPTCTQTGLTEGKNCSRCKEIFVKQEVIPALNHIVVVDEALEPTCTQAGLTQGCHCSRCGEVLVEQEVVVALGHSYDNSNKCTVCGKNLTVAGVETYVLEASAFAQFAQGTKYDGQTEAAGTLDFFTMYWGIKTKLDSSSKTWEDGYASGQRFNMGGKTVLNEETIAYAIQFTTKGAATVKVWWVGGGDGRSLAIWDGEKTEIASTGTNVVKNEICYHELTIAEAGTYFLALPEGSNYIFKVVVDVAIEENGAGEDFDHEDPVNATPDEYFTFTLLSDGTYSIEAKDKNNMPSKVVLPSTCNGKTVTVIANNAFYNCSSLMSVVIPDSVTSIGNYAFAGCDSLTSVVIPDSVTSIGDWAFDNCDSLQYNVKDNLKYLGNTNNPYLYLADVATMDIATANIDENCKLIGYAAFDGCYNLTSVVIGDSVTSIGDNAFQGCYSLTSVVIGDSVTSIGYAAFDGCYNLTSVVIGDSVTSIGSTAFYNCNSLTSVVIPDSVTSIGEEAFFNCDSLTSVVIGDSVTSIGLGAFENCSGLTSVVIGDSVTSIGSTAFYNCNSLTSIKYRGTQTQWNKITKGTNWNYYTGNYTITYNYSGE